MKKSTIIVIAIIMAVVAVLAIVAGVIFMGMNKEKTPITASEFSTTVQEKGFEVQDVSDMYGEYDHIEKVIIAAKDNFSYQIEFYEMGDEDGAVNFYNTNKAIFELSKGNSSAETSVSLKNYAKYTLSSGGKYMVVSRIDNTVVYVAVDSQYKDAVSEVLKAIGY